MESSLLLLDGKDTAASQAEAIRDDVIPRMRELRALCDEAETIIPESVWPFPTYGALLFSVK